MKKGFTLIELLAVIIILAVIALVATPIVLDVIEDAKMSSIQSSTYNYVNAVELKLLDGLMDLNQKMPNGMYDIRDLNVEITGESPKQGIVIINDYKVESAKFCVENYSIYYDGKVNFVENDYCAVDFNVVLDVNGNITEKNIGASSITDFDISNFDLTNLEAVHCNNGGIPSIEDNILTINNIYGNTKCEIKLLDEIVSNIDNTENYIIMLNDATLGKDLVINEGSLIFDANGKIIQLGEHRIINYSKLELLSQLDGSVVYSLISVVKNYGNFILRNVDLISQSTLDHSALNNDGIVNIYDSYIEGPFAVGGFNSDEARFYMFSGELLGKKYRGLQLNAGYTSEAYMYGGKISSMESVGIGAYSKGNVYIYGGIITSETSQAIASSDVSNVYIKSDSTPIYISNLAQSWIPVIHSYNNSNIYINGISADYCTSNYVDTTFGICIYAGEGNGGIQNLSTGNVVIDGATIYGGSQGVNNGSTGNTYILNAEIISSNTGVLNHTSGNIYICNADIDAETYHLWSNTAGNIYYSDSVNFKNSQAEFKGTTNIVDNQTACQKP